jgi:LPS O-antigen subunit length determinant protein (WzzB/FepE family)
MRPSNFIPSEVRLHETWAVQEAERMKRAHQRRTALWVIVGLLGGALLGNLLFLTDVKTVLKRVDRQLEMREGIQ